MLCQYKEGKCVRGLGPFRNKDAIYCKQKRPCGSLLSKNNQNMLRANMGNENNYIMRHNTNNNTNNNTKRHKKPKSNRRNGKSSTRRRR
jgi:hypothetical protein